MNGLDKIIEQIMAEANQKAQSIIDDADQKAADIINKAQEEATLSCQQLAEQGQRDAERVISFAESSAHIEGKKLILQAKSNIITDVIEEAHKRILSLNDKDYFEVLLNMIKLFARNEDGQLLLNQKDLNRLPGDFEAKASKAVGKKLTVSQNSCKIDGGFILSYGGIEENCSFDTIFKVKNEQLRDKVSSIVFA